MCNCVCHTMIGTEPRCVHCRGLDYERKNLNLLKATRGGSSVYVLTQITPAGEIGSDALDRTVKYFYKT